MQSGEALAELRMAVRFLRSALSRLWLTLVALACGVALVCAIDLANEEVMRSFAEAVDAIAGRAALQVSAGEGGSFPETVADTVAAVDGVELAAPVVSGVAFTTDDSGTLLTVQGIDVTSDAALRIYETRADVTEVDDPLVLLSQPDSIVLTRVFAARHGLAVGDRLPLLTPRGARTFTVRGLLEPQGMARVYGGDLAVLDVYAAEVVFTSPGLINRIDLVLRPDADRDRVEEAVRAVLPPGLRVETPAQRKADLGAVVQSLRVMLRALGLVVLVAAFLIAFNRMTTVFEERAWQAGVLRAVGVRQRGVARTFLAEALVVGVGGIALGLPLGWALAHAILPTVATTTAIATDLLVKPRSLRLDLATVGIAALLGLGTAILAAIVPARRVARRALIATVRSRGVEAPPASGRGTTVLRIVVLVALVAVTIGQWRTHHAGYGLVATVLIAVVVALAARPLLAMALPVLAPLLAALAGPSGRFAAAVLTRNRRRTGLILATLGVGVGAVFWVWTIAMSFERSLVGMLAPTFGGDLSVASVRQGSGLWEAPLDDGVLERLLEVPGVEEVAGQRMQPWTLHGRPIVVLSIDGNYLRDGRLGHWVLVGPHVPDAFQAIARGTGVAVSTNFEAHFGLRFGDELVLDTPNGPLALPIVGTTVDFASPGGTVRMSRELYSRMWNNHQVNTVQLRVAAGGVDAARAEIARRLGREYGLRIFSSGELLAHYASQARQAFSVIDVLGVLVMVVVMVGMADTLAAGVMEQAQELGAMRSLGVRRGQLGRMILAQSFALAVLGLLLAAVAGLALGALWVLATFPALLGWTLELHVPYRQLLVASAIALTVCLLAALSPARRIARLEPAAALRYE
jgi:putative ABC transport system permease protein